MSQEQINKIFDIAIKDFHKWYGLLGAVFLVWITFLPMFSLIPNGEISFNHYIYGIITLSIVVIIYWAYHKWHYPIRSADKLGLTIAIHVEDGTDQKFFKKDFISPLKNRISEQSLPFQLLILQNHQSENVETLEDARKILKKTKGQFCLWGSIKRRENAPAGEKYIFLLRGAVVHKPIKEVQKILLVKEFDILLPHTFEFERNMQFKGFEFRANQVVVALDYVTGRAALLSGDYNTAIKLHEALFTQLEQGLLFPLNKEELKNLISFEYEIKSHFELFKPELGSYKDSVAKSLKYNPNNYGALLKKAIAEFDHGQGDPKTALGTIQNAKKYSNGKFEWLYSEAFLYFWLGKYDRALNSCRKLKEISYEWEEITIREVIDFNINLLKTYKMPQLKYWVGFVSYIKDENPAFADKYFQEFIDEADNTMKDLTPRAKSYLVEIKKKIGY